jgi:hypothetical protein
MGHQALTLQMTDYLRQPRRPFRMACASDVIQKAVVIIKQRHGIFTMN